MVLIDGKEEFILWAESALEFDACFTSFKRHESETGRRSFYPCFILRSQRHRASGVLGHEVILCIGFFQAEIDLSACKN